MWYGYPAPYYGVLGLLILALDIVAIMNVIAGKSSPERKVMWVFFILLLPFLGMICYFLVGRSSKDVTVV